MSGEIQSTIRAALNAWLTRVDDVDYSILKGEHEDALIKEIAERVSVSIDAGAQGQ